MVMLGWLDVSLSLSLSLSPSLNLSLRLSSSLSLSLHYEAIGYVIDYRAIDSCEYLNTFTFKLAGYTVMFEKFETCKFLKCMLFRLRLMAFGRDYYSAMWASGLIGTRAYWSSSSTYTFGELLLFATTELRCLARMRWRELSAWSARPSASSSSRW